MKKRIRKKLHLKEFAEYGCFFVVNCGLEEGEKTLEKATDIADKYDAACWGGGNGLYVMPECDPNYVLPKFIEEVALCSALELQAGTMMFCLKSKNQSDLPPEIEKTVRDAFPTERYNLRINPQVNLWPRKK